MMNIYEVNRRLKQRPPFQMIERVTELTPGEAAVGLKTVSVNDPWFAGHFPGEPILPGVLIIEALAQVGAVAILSLPENQGKTAYFGAIDKCKFKGKVVPGDKLRLETRIIKRKGPVGVGEAIASVDGRVVVRAELTFMIG